MIHKTSKKVLSWLLSLALVLSLLPGLSLTAYAAETHYTITPSNLDWPEGQYNALATNVTFPYQTDAKALLAAIGYTSDSISYITSTSISSGTNVSLGESTGTSGTADYNVGINITGQGESVVEVVAYATWSDTITCRIAVSVYPADVILPTISLEEDELTIATGNKMPLTATITPDNATDKTVKWSVSGTNPDAIKLYSDENCTTEIGSDATSALTVYAKGISAGNATVTVTSNSYTTRTASCEMTVSDQYHLWIGGEEVTSTNSSGAGWSYDVGSNTIALSNYSYTGVGYKEGNTDDPCSAIYYTGSAPLIIQLSGTNTITRTGSSDSHFGDASYCGIKTKNCSSLTITGSSTDSLSVICEGNKSSAIYLNGYNTTLTVQNVSLTTATTADSGNPSISSSLVKVVQGASVTATGGYNGISAEVEIGENSSVVAAGNNKAISWTVKNAITGTGWVDKEGNTDKADIAASTEGQTLTYKKVQFPAVPSHTHSFSYSASGATITATCTADGCTLPPSTEGGSDHVATLTIVAPLHTNVGDGKSAAATITDASNIKGSATVSYYAATKSGTTYTKTGDALGSAPTAAGNYVAEITVGGVTASVGYTIKVAGGEATAVAVPDDVTASAPTGIVLTGIAGQEYVIVKKEGSPDWDDAVVPNSEGAVVFWSLDPATEYDIYTRVAETANTYAGEAKKTAYITVLESVGTIFDSDLVGATWTADPDPDDTGSYTYQWYRVAITDDVEGDETAISGATNHSYTLTAGDVNNYVFYKVYMNGTEIGESSPLGPASTTAAVSFDSMGGSAVETQTGLAYGAYVAKPDDDPTRSGYSFAGWYTDTDYYTKWSFDVDTVKWAETTLYAKWTAAPVYEITGVVKNSSDAAVSGAAVTLAQGYKTLGQTTTDASGAFTFSGVESGTYNVIAKKETQTKTELVELTANQSLEIKLPAVGKNSVLDNDNAGDLPAIVGGLDKIAAEETVSGDSTVTITLTVTAEDFISDSKKAQFATEKAAIQTVAAGKTLECLDLTLQKVVTGTGAVTTNIGDSNTQLLTIIIPYATSGKQNVAVYRYHGTTAEALTQNPTSGAEGFMVGTDSITLYARGFSTYAIGYTTPTAPTPTPTPSRSGGGGGSSGSTVTVPVSGDSASVSVSASVSGSTATVKAPTTALLDKVIGESVKTGDVTIDVSGLKKDIATVSIPAETVKAIEKAVSDPDNDANALTVKLTDGSVTFDAAALAAIAQQAKGSTIQLNLDNIGESKLKTAQKTAIRDLDVQAVYDAYMTSNGQRISDFKGGKAAVTVSYTLKDGQTGRGVVVWYVADDGKTTEVPTAYNDKTVSFTVEHFSNYVIAYDAQRAAVCPKDDTCPISAFSDASATAWYHDGVHYVLESGIMNGVGNGKFGPGDATSRAMIAQILWNMEGKPVVNYALSYTDVDGEAWYTEAVRWVTSEKIMSGYGGGKFGPGDAMTREQLVTIMYRYAQYKGVDVSVGEDTNILSYDDALTVSEFAIPAMQWAVGSGAVSGRTNTTLNPKDTATRAEIATIIMRYCTEIAK